MYRRHGRKKVSIIVPVYNVEEYLRKCIESILNQIYCNLEIILVDDDSTDKSGIICDEYALIDERIRVIHIEKCKMREIKSRFTE